MQNQLQLKQAVAQAALTYVKPNSIIGVGTGSTVNCFIEKLINSKIPIKGTISSSNISTKLLQQGGITVFDANEILQLDVYIDGADEIDHNGYMIKGGGAALTREKIVAARAKQFICIVDQSKQVTTLGKFPLPVEVMPMAISWLQQQFKQLGATAILRCNQDNKPIITDNGLYILDVHNLKITNPLNLEMQISQLPGVLTVGIFAKQKATTCLIAKQDGIITQNFNQTNL